MNPSKLIFRFACVTIAAAAASTAGLGCTTDNSTGPSTTDGGGSSGSGSSSGASGSSSGSGSGSGSSGSGSSSSGGGSCVSDASTCNSCTAPDADPHNACSPYAGGCTHFDNARVPFPKPIVP
jgi:hypothetical protein